MNNNDIEKINLDEADSVESTEEYEEDEVSAKTVAKRILFDSIYILIVVLLSFLLVKYVGQRTIVVGSSMETTLQDKDNLIVDKISYKFGDPERFDIIIFPAEFDNKEYLIKRVIGLPGETVKIDYSGNIYINGKILEESYGREIIQDPGVAWNSILLADDEYFVLGDNRNHSSDSRSVLVGNVKRGDIIGKAWLRVKPLSKFGFLKDHE